MQKLFTFFTILFSISFLSAQTSLNTDLIYKFHDEKATQEIINVLVLTRMEETVDFSFLSDIKVNYSYGNIFSVTGSINSLKRLARSKNILRMEYVQHHMELLADTCMVKNRIQNVKLGLPPLAKNYDGTGVIMGVIDSGTDFSHPDFKDASGKSRIKFLWDMTKPVAANTPTPFGYGQEWTNADIDSGLCTHSDLAYWGHGTASSGIAAGNGLSVNHFEGVAPKADIIVVAFDFARSGFIIADAVQYLVNRAQLLGKPLSINLSLGDYYGSHDGTDLETQMINNMVTASPGRAIVGAAGNAGDRAFHVGYNTTALDTNFTWIKNSSAGIYVTEYSDSTQFKNVKYSIGVNNTGYTDLGNIGFKNYSYALNTVKRDTIYYNSNRIGIVETAASVNTFGVYELAFHIIPDSLNYYWRIEHNGPGRIDSWNFDYVSGGLPSALVYPGITKFKKADTLQTMVSGFQCSNEVITVANYINRNQWVDVNNNIQVTTEISGAIAPNSSFGPTRDGRVKPDISATGNNILTTMAMGLQANYIASSPNRVAQGGFHFIVGGTSAASPVVAGLTALYLQMNPSATNQQIRQAIINCAYTDGFTGAVPNSRWGNGKLDGFAAITCTTTPTDLVDESQMNSMLVSPNPFSDYTMVTFKNSEPKTLELFDSTGRLIMQDECKEKEYILNKGDLSSGIYMLISHEKNSYKHVKLLIQ